MSQLLLYNARVILADGVQRGGMVARDGRIAAVFKGADAPAGMSRSEAVDLRGAYLAPGLIDIHIHGSAGVDVLDADSDALRKLSDFLLSEGVTGYFATLVPTDDRGYKESLARITSFINHQQQGGKARRGAQILGVHFEGPFVSHNKCGALHRERFRTYDGDHRAVEIFTNAGARSGEPISRLMTLAPEIEGGLDLARDLAQSGVRVFIGHSQAAPQTLDLALRAGACHITHFPNALEPLHHRKPGAVGWGLVRAEVTLDCIADLHHVDPMMLRLIYQAKGADRMALISDAVLPTGLGDGEFSIWGETILVRNGKTELAGGAAKGTIAGSVITMRQALKNMIELGVPLHEAVRMAALVPARAAGVEDQLGSIEEGKRADLVAFDDDFNVQLAAVEGEISVDNRK